MLWMYSTTQTWSEKGNADSNILKASDSARIWLLWYDVLQYLVVAAGADDFQDAESGKIFASFSAGLTAGVQSPTDKFLDKKELIVFQTGIRLGCPG